METSQVVVLILAAVACWSDLRTRRIPNIVTFGGAVTPAVTGSVGDGPDESGSVLTVVLEASTAPEAVIGAGVEQAQGVAAQAGCPQGLCEKQG